VPEIKAACLEDRALYGQYVLWIDVEDSTNILDFFRLALGQKGRDYATSHNYHEIMALGVLDFGQQSWVENQAPVKMDHRCRVGRNLLA